MTAVLCCLVLSSYCAACIFGVVNWNLFFNFTSEQMLHCRNRKLCSYQEMIIFQIVFFNSLSIANVKGKNCIFPQRSYSHQHLGGKICTQREAERENSHSLHSLLTSVWIVSQSYFNVYFIFMFFGCIFYVFLQIRHAAFMFLSCFFCPSANSPNCKMDSFCKAKRKCLFNGKIKAVTDFCLAKVEISRTGWRFF